MSMQKLLLAHGGALSNLPLFVAIDGGLLEARGFAALAPQCDGFQSTAEMLSSDAAGLGTTGFTRALVEHALPDPLRIVGGSGKLGMALVAQPGMSVRDLRGRHVGTFADDPMEVLLYDALHAHDVSFGEIECIRYDSLGSAVRDLREHRIAALTAVEPWISRLEVQGFEVLCDGVHAWGGDYPDTLLVARASFLRAHPDVVRAVVSAMLEAQALILQDPAAAVRLSAHRWPEFTIDELLAGIARQPPDVDIRPLRHCILARASSLEALGRMRVTSSLSEIFALDLLDQVIGHRSPA
ncbi:MAG: ABC transporter substrate-binding protein [Burkholderia contaminans]|uniref:SsuA/THI5-like domain-containing protein n=2 Tax=Pseudomonadota TaxID=1224 RepID=A0A228HMA5_9BURK|nr:MULTISPECIES: ABC transporter substrate-binding protein [Burkholderia cepacia complex]MBR8010137.1 ABC transporter substrate-binding protein [Burkholderia vietnamiensis]MBR8151540.1 ABC transporter substrate-binding protein [Burkholderia vietnamiensis]MBR8165416.1 ABC transporter substrate-binding protein [Burkholderia vietnamiensis]MBR8193886.1 ABC transporter substrate-binding protein [Burkholderia vietnamiensis]MCA8291600.1 ABC transporter substrate-binding protein [Burkholderia vietnami